MKSIIPSLYHHGFLLCRYRSMCVSKCVGEMKAGGGGDVKSRFINVASPAKIQGVLLHPAVTGCARLRCHGNTTLRACSRSFIQF